MPKDNENIPLMDLGPVAPSEPQGFAPEQMVRCDQCLRANPPTRVTCLYCATPLSVDEKTAALQRPTLRPLEKWEQGYSNVLKANQPELDPRTVQDIAGLLKLSVEQISKILDSHASLPVARTATIDEATLIKRRLTDTGLLTSVVSDEELGMEDLPPMRIRGIEIEDDGFLAHLTGGGESLYTSWSSLTLLVHGRLVVKSVEVKEQKGGRDDTRIVDSTETYVDEAVLDIYSNERRGNFRITANSFDFSCLVSRKGLVAEDNLKQMISFLQESAPNVSFDDTYKRLRSSLDAVWPAVGQTESRGWKRERPGRYSLGAMTETSNETQFTRFSRLRHHLTRRND